MFLNLASFEDANTCIASNISYVKKTMEIKIEDACGKILANDVVSPINVPAYPKSQMDGYALRSKDTFSASDVSKISLDIIAYIDAGCTDNITVSEGTCAYVATGARVPEGADAVIMIEDTISENGRITLAKGIAPGQNIMSPGFDIRSGNIVFSKDELVTPRIIGALSGMGISKIHVYSTPRIAIFSTGDELRMPGDAPTIASTYDINGPFLASACTSLGCDATYLGIASDDEKELRSMLKVAAKYDLVLMSAGVSKGARDLSEKILGSMGTILLHGVNIKPGKPTLIAKVGSTMIIGLPGHPTSCAIIFTMLVVPHILRMRGKEYSPVIHKMPLSKRIYVPKGRRQFLPVRIENEEASPVFRGSGAITSFTSANAIAIIGENDEFLDKGDIVSVVRLGDINI